MASYQNRKTGEIINVISYRKKTIKHNQIYFIRNG